MKLINSKYPVQAFLQDMTAKKKTREEENKKTKKETGKGLRKTKKRASPSSGKSQIGKTARQKGKAIQKSSQKRTKTTVTVNGQIRVEHFETRNKT